MIDQGQSGFIVNKVEEAVTAVERAKGLGRAGVRGCFERRFTVERMILCAFSLFFFRFSITSVTVTASFWQRLIHIGDIEIDSASEMGKIVLDDIHYPERYANMILDELRRRN